MRRPDRTTQGPPPPEPRTQNPEPIRILLPVPEWRNWQTHQTQNLARLTSRGGSSPPSGSLESMTYADFLRHDSPLNLATVPKTVPAQLALFAF